MCICQVASDINISGVFSDAQVVASGRRPRPSQALADWYAIATVPVPEPKALPERRNSYCDTCATGEHRSARRRTRPCPSTRGTLWTDAGEFHHNSPRRDTDGRTGKISLVSPWALHASGKISLVSPWALHASGKTLPPPFSRAPLLFFCLFYHRAHAITDKVIQVNVKIPYLLISVSCPTVCFETEAQDLRPMSCISYILQCQFPTQLDTVLVAHPLGICICFLKVASITSASVCPVSSASNLGQRCLSLGQRCNFTHSMSASCFVSWMCASCTWSNSCLVVDINFAMN